MVTNNTKPTLEETQTFNKACNHPNEDSQQNGKKQFAKQLTNMNKQQLWQMMHKSLMPPQMDLQN